MENTGNRHFALTLLSISFLQALASSAASPALGRIGAEFTDAGMPTIQMVMTLPSICIIVAGFLVVHLIDRYTAKKTMIAGLVLYLIGGVGGMAAIDIYTLLFFRIVLGFGLGLVTPLLPILVSANYEGLSRPRMMGYCQSSNFLGGITGTILGGILASFGWRNIFWIYLVAIPGLCLSFSSLPSSRGPAAPAGTGAAAPAKTPYTLTSILLGVVMLLHAVFFMKASLTIAMYMPTIGIHTTTSPGFAVGVMYFGSLLAGLSVVPFGKALGRARFPVVFLIEATAFILLAQTNSFAVVCVATGLLGFGNGIFVPSWFALVPENVDRPLVPKTMTLVNMSLYLGMFLSPYASVLVKRLGRNTIQFDYQVVAACLLLMAAGAAYSGLRAQRHARG